MGKTNESPLESTLLTIAIAAIGAILALFFNGYANHRTALYKRRLQHTNSLVMLQLRLLDIDAILHDKRVLKGARP